MKLLKEFYDNVYANSSQIDKYEYVLTLVHNLFIQYKLLKEEKNIKHK